MPTCFSAAGKAVFAACKSLSAAAPVREAAGNDAPDTAEARHSLTRCLKAYVQVFLDARLSKFPTASPGRASQPAPAHQAPPA